MKSVLIFLIIFLCFPIHIFAMEYKIKNDIKHTHIIIYTAENEEDLKDKYYINDTYGRRKGEIEKNSYGGFYINDSYGRREGEIVP